MASSDTIQIVVQATDAASDTFKSIGQSSDDMRQSIGQAMTSSNAEIGNTQENLIGLRDTAVSSFSEYTNEVSEAMSVVKNLAELMPWFSSALLSPWTLVAIEIGFAIKKYGEYMASIREWRGKEAAIDDPFTPADVKERLQSSGKGMGDYRESERKSEATPPLSPLQPSPVGLSSGFNIDIVSNRIAEEAKRAAEELQRMQDRLSQMIEGLDEKIIGETGTTLQLNSARMTNEIEKMYKTLQEMAGKGIDISGATAKIDEYRKVMLARFNLDQENAQKETKNQADQLAANVDNNKGLLADLQKEAAYLAADKESLNVYQKTGNKELADNLKKERYAAADKTNSDTHRDINLEEINQQIQHNEMLITLENKTQAEVDIINKNALENKIILLDADIKAAGNNKAQVLKFEQEKVDATNKLHQISGRSMATASDEAMRRIKAQTFDYAGLMVDTFNEINGSISNHLGKMLQGTESFSQGMKGIFSDMITNIENMMLKMWMQKTIMGPLESLFGNILGVSNSSSGQIGGFSENLLKNTTFDIGYTPKKFANGGSYPGGLALVGEEGPEIINFDNPGQVYTADQTQKIINSGNSQQQQPKITVNVTNNTDTKVKTTQKATYDSETQTTIISLFIDGLDRNVGGLRDAVFGGAG